MNILTSQEDANPIVIRQPNESDLKQVSEIYQQSVLDNPKGFVQDFSFHGEIGATTKEYVAQGGETLVACQDNEVLGFGALKPLKNGTTELCKLHVNKCYQKQGVGQKLSKRLISRAKELGFKKVELHVTATQKAAIKLYQKLGFKQIDQKIYVINVNKKNCSFDTVFMQLTPS